MERPISVDEAAELLGLSRSGVMEAIRTGRLVAILINGRALALCREQVLGKPFSEPEFRRLCGRYVSVPDACEIMRKTDAAVIRDLNRGRVDGFRLNGRAWAVDKRSAEREFAEYLRSDRGRGQPRRLSESRSPRVLRKPKRKTLAKKR
jgi:excisionase family DNA binding protein